MQATRSDRTETLIDGKWVNSKPLAGLGTENARAKQVQPKSQANKEWPELKSLGDDLLPVMAFDSAALPDAFREYVCDVAERMQVPVDLPAVCAVACLGGAVNRRVSIQPKRADPWVVTPNLWAGIVAPPGRMKSNILGTFTKHLSGIETSWRSDYETAINEYERWEREQDLKVQAWKEQYKAAVKKGDKQSLPGYPNETQAKPILRRLIANDPTCEALHHILAENPAGVLLVRDELSGWLSTLDKPGREGERQFFLEAWNGDQPFVVDRISRGTIHVPALCLSIVGGIQPGRLRQYLVDAVKDGPGNDGLFQRLQLIVWPDFSKDWKLIDRPANETAARRVAKVYESLARLSTEDPLRLKFSEEGQELFFKWLTELEKKIRCDDLHPALAAHLAKYRSLMPSLALLFELADSEGPTMPANVSLVHAQQAGAWCDYLESHARRIYGCLVSPELHAARQLADKIERRKLAEEFSTRDVYLKGWSGLGTPEDARAALRILEDAGWVRPVDVKEREGRPSERWEINPRKTKEASK